MRNFLNLLISNLALYEIIYWVETWISKNKWFKINLTCQFKRFNMWAQLQLKNIIKKFSILMHIFEIWLDFKFCWNEHIKMIKYKIITQINALFCIIIFIWKIIFINVQQIYSAVIRSILIYESAVWHFFSFSKQKIVISHTVKSIAVKLTDV